VGVGTALLTKGFVGTFEKADLGYGLIYSACCFIDEALFELLLA